MAKPDNNLADASEKTCEKVLWRLSIYICCMHLCKDHKYFSHLQVQHKVLTISYRQAVHSTLIFPPTCQPFLPPAGSFTHSCLLILFSVALVFKLELPVLPQVCNYTLVVSLSGIQLKTMTTQPQESTSSQQLSGEGRGGSMSTPMVHDLLLTGQSYADSEQVLKAIKRPCLYWPGHPHNGCIILQRQNFTALFPDFQPLHSF